MATWFITGAARGLGFEIAQRALAAGDNVVATARNESSIDEAFRHSPGGRILSVALDVTDETQAGKATAAALAMFGGIDFLVNNAGRGLVGAVEEASAAEVQTVFETNVFGVLNVIRAVLPSMRARRSGHIVNVGSMGGFAQVAGWGVYGATKFALEGLSEAMHAELLPLGISVTIVELGSFRTNFLDGSSLQTIEREDADYFETAGRVRHAVGESNGGQPSDPARGAAVIVDAVTSKNPPLRLQVGPDAVAMVEGKLARVRDELEAWRDVASNTAFVANTSNSAA
jgi:NAD(P)-dependent dehydrogenase (short-subunit alcohol dehydrogenase family)